MSELIAEVPAAGWYQDPNDDGSMRWWSGEGWTDHTQPMAPARPQESLRPATGSTAGSAGTDWVSNYTVDELALYTGRPVEHAVSSRTGRTVLEFTGTVPDWRRERTGATTAQVWMIALVPALIAGLALAWLLVGAPFRIPGLVLGIAALVGALSTMLLAVGDSRSLRARGLSAPSPTWILLGSVGFLIARAVNVRRSGASGTAPLVVGLLGSVALGTVVAALSVTLIPALAQQSSQVESGASQSLIVQQTEQSVQADLLSKGQNWKVDCGGAAVAIAPNSSFRCKGINGADSSKATIAVVYDAQQRMTYTITPTAAP